MCWWVTRRSQAGSCHLFLVFTLGFVDPSYIFVVQSKNAWDFLIQCEPLNTELHHLKQNSNEMCYNTKQKIGSLISSFISVWLYILFSNAIVLHAWLWVDTLACLCPDLFGMQPPLQQPGPMLPALTQAQNLEVSERHTRTSLVAASLMRKVSWQKTKNRTVWTLQIKFLPLRNVAVVESYVIWITGEICVLRFRNAAVPCVYIQAAGVFLDMKSSLSSATVVC